MPTLAEATALLSQYVGTGNSATDRINLAVARLLEDGAWPGMMPQIPFAVYEDADGAPIVTLPRKYLAILRGYPVPPNATNWLCRGAFMGVNGVFSEGSVWYGGSSVYPGGSFNRDFQEVSDYFCLFKEWTGAKLIRLKFEQNESAGTIYLSGTSEGADVWNTNTATWERREAIAFTGTTAVTSTHTFDAKGFKFVKPVTLGRVSAYTVDSDGTETLVAIYQPDELRPRWRRYRVPCGLNATNPWTYVAIVKLGYVPLVNAYDEVIPGNIGALRFALNALLKEDAQDITGPTGSETFWQLARERLVRQAESESEGVRDRIEVDDDMNMAGIGNHY